MNSNTTEFIKDFLRGKNANENSTAGKNKEASIAFPELPRHLLKWGGAGAGLSTLDFR